MRSTTRNRLLGIGIFATAGLYVTLATIDGANSRPLVNDIEDNAVSLWNDGILDGFETIADWMLTPELNPATILLGVVAWVVARVLARRANRRWDLTGHTIRALRSKPSKATGKWTGIVLGSALALSALFVGGAYGAVALGENFKPEVVAAANSVERTVDGLFEEEEPKAAPAIPAPTGNTGDKPADTSSTAPAQPTDEPTAEPTDTDATTGDKKTETPAEPRTDSSDDKPVTDAFTSLANHGDRIFTDPVKWADEEPWKAIGLVAFVLLWLCWNLLKWRRNALMVRELAYLRGRVRTQNGQLSALRDQIGAEDENTDASVMDRIATLDRYVRDDDRRLTALETKPRHSSGPDKLVAGGPTD